MSTLPTEELLARTQDPPSLDVLVLGHDSPWPGGGSAGLTQSWQRKAARILAGNLPGFALQREAIFQPILGSPAQHLTSLPCNGHLTVPSLQKGLTGQPQSMSFSLEYGLDTQKQHTNLDAHNSIAETSESKHNLDAAQSEVSLKIILSISPTADAVTSFL